MKQLFIIVLLSVSRNLFAQDIIIKNDKSEIKSKVVEIEPAVIKYKQFDFQSGPTYSIEKGEVFMVIYSNGRRETFNPSVSAVKTKRIAELHTQTNPAADSGIYAKYDSSQNNDRTVHYSPWRLLNNIYNPDEFSNGYGMSLSFESNLLKNRSGLNWGMEYSFMNVNGKYNDGNLETNSSANGVSTYISGYLPVNLLMKNFEQKDKGFFPFVRTGVTYSWISGSSLSYLPFNKDKYSDSSFDFDYGLGVDCFVIKGFGLSAYYRHFKSLWWGIIFTF